jgi:hypothetical protein
VSLGPGGIHKVFVVGQAGGVGEQVPNRDGLAVGRELGEDLTERLVVAEFAVVDQQHDGHGSELLGAGGEAEVGGLVDGREAVEVGDAIALFKHCAAVLFDQDGHAWSMRVG